MNDLSPSARAACDALRADSGSDAERERVRARLNALGVAITLSAGSALAVSTASAASGVAGASISAGALPSASLTAQAGAPALASSVGLGAKSALMGAATASKLAAVPLVLKAGIVVVALGSTLAAPKLLGTPQPARETVSEGQAAAPARERKAPARKVRESRLEQVPSVTPLVAHEEPRASNAAPAVAPRRQAVTGGARSAATAAARAAESTLAGESALLEQALTALRAGRAERARELLSRHEDIYGAHALLARERERMRRELSHLLR